MPETSDSSESIDSGAADLPRPPSYLQCRHIIACLQDLQDLATHHGLLEGMLRKPRKALDQLSPHAAGADPHERSQVMIERFNQLIPIVTGYLDAAGISTEVVLEI